MKTAMQELLDWTMQYQGKMISADQVGLKAYELLKKEQLQMFLIFDYCYGAPDILTDEEKKEMFYDAYNYHFNQNK